MAYQQTTFELPEKLLNQLDKFKKEQDANVLTKQVEFALDYLNRNPKENPLDSKWKWAKNILESASFNQPYAGCSGGGYSYTFTPTTVGVSIKVTCNSTKESLDYFQEY